MPSSPLPFPFYFEELYRFVHQLEQYDQQLLNCSPIQQRSIYEHKFHHLLTQIPTLLLSLHTQQGQELLMPYILDACRHPVYGIRCLYALFNPVATILGPEETRKHFLTLIQSALNPERTTIYHWSCFTRRFVIQLIARFTLMKFLQNFSLFLIEACSGFKDEITFIEETNESTPEANDSLHERPETLTPQDSDSHSSEVETRLSLNIFSCLLDQ